MLKNKLNKKKKKGFTLIELIVVLAVLAIIALIAIPNFNRIRENSKIKADERGADLIDKAVTILVLEGTLKDGEYKVAGSSVTPVASALQADLISGILENPEVQQATTNKFFTVKISAAESAAPKVDVQVGNYSSDGNTVTR